MASQSREIWFIFTFCLFSSDRSITEAFSCRNLLNGRSVPVEPASMWEKCTLLLSILEWNLHEIYCNVLATFAVAAVWCFVLMSMQIGHGRWEDCPLYCTFNSTH